MSVRNTELDVIKSIYAHSLDYCNRFFLAQCCQKFFVTHRVRKHGKIMFNGTTMRFFTHRGGAVLQPDDVVSELVAGPHRRFHAAIGEKAAQNYSIDFLAS